jgi:hypothetical protein
MRAEYPSKENPMSVLALFEFKALPARMKEVKAGLAQAHEPQGSEPQGSEVVEAEIDSVVPQGRARA